MTPAAETRRAPAHRAAPLALLLTLGTLALAGCTAPVTECKPGVADLAHAAEVLPPC